MIKSGTICNFSKLSTTMPMMKPNRLKVTAVNSYARENKHPLLCDMEES